MLYCCQSCSCAGRDPSAPVGACNSEKSCIMGHSPWNGGSGYERGPSRLFYITAATDDKPIPGWSDLDSEIWDGSRAPLTPTIHQFSPRTRIERRITRTGKASQAAKAN